MSRADSGLRTVAVVVGVLVLVPVVMMGVVMPLAAFAGVGYVPSAFAGGGHMGSAFGGWWILMPLVPLAVFGGLAYLLYVAVSEDAGRREAGARRTDGGGDADAGLDALRAAYGRGELSDAEFERRRERLRSGAGDASDSGASEAE